MIIEKKLTILGMIGWNIAMLVWNYYDGDWPLMLFLIMCSLPTILIFGIFTALDENESQNFEKVSRN